MENLFTRYVKPGGAVYLKLPSTPRLFEDVYPVKCRQLDYCSPSHLKNP